MTVATIDLTDYIRVGGRGTARAACVPEGAAGGEGERMKQHMPRIIPLIIDGKFNPLLDSRDINWLRDSTAGLACQVCNDTRYRVITITLLGGSEVRICCACLEQACEYAQ